MITSKQATVRIYCVCVCGGGILIDLYPMRQLQKEIWSDLFDTDKEGFPKNIVKIKFKRRKVS